MASKSVEWTGLAKKQRRSILQYWTRRNGSPAFSIKLIKLTAATVKVIQRNPESFKRADYASTRICSMGQFSILYKIKEDKILITSFWDNRQDPKKLWQILQTEEN